MPADSPPAQDAGWVELVASSWTDGESAAGRQEQLRPDGKASPHSVQEYDPSLSLFQVNRGFQATNSDTDSRTVRSICVETLIDFPVVMAVYAETVLDRLTIRQTEVLEFLRRFIGAKGYPPTMRDICRAFGWRSIQAASDHLQALKRKGAIALTPGVSRGIRVLV